MKRDAYLELVGFHLGGDALTFVRERREKGSTYQKIARDLYLATDGKVDVSFSTIRNWLNNGSAA